MFGSLVGRVVLVGVSRFFLGTGTDHGGQSIMEGCD